MRALLFLPMVLMLPVASAFCSPESPAFYSDGYIMPGQFRQVNEQDDTACVNKAFQDGRNVRFDHDYSVSTVLIAGGSRTIDFNGYKLVGNAGEKKLDAVVTIAGSRLTLVNVHVDADWRNYRSAVHWVSLRDSPSTQYNRVLGMRIEGAGIGLLFGNYLDEQPSSRAAESENYVEGMQFFNVEKCIQMNALNGSLFISNSNIDCTNYQWRDDFISYRARDSRAVQVKAGFLKISSSEILKPQSAEGYALEGSYGISGCRIETGGSAILAGNGNEIFITDTSIQIPSRSPFHPIVDVTGSRGTRCVIADSNLIAGSVASYFGAAPRDTQIVIANCLVQPRQSLTADFITSTNTMFK